MSTDPIQSKKLRDRLRERYRLVIMEDETLELRNSIKVTLLNVYLAASVLFVVIGALVFCLIYFTPMKNYLVGFNQVELSRQALAQEQLIDSLSNITDTHQQWIDNILRQLNGEVDTASSGVADQVNLSNINLDQVSPEDLALRDEVDQRDYFTLEQNGENRRLLSPPMEGVISDGFDPSEEHYGIDIVGKENSAVKAVDDGTVIDTYWDSETGNCIVLQHDNNLISIYKHNSSILKKVGTFVRSGDAIAIVGNTGELSSGPHLHMELWKDRAPLNPEDHIVFN
jgi:murein DD-endopeptidase MepM/ murein hydrolase activator NlpD